MHHNQILFIFNSSINNKCHIECTRSAGQPKRLIGRERERALRQCVQILCSCSHGAVNWGSALQVNIIGKVTLPMLLCDHCEDNTTSYKLTVHSTLSFSPSLSCSQSFASFIGCGIPVQSQSFDTQRAGCNVQFRRRELYQKSVCCYIFCWIIEISFESSDNASCLFCT